MVHRPADSRLLTNLLSHEKDYSKQLIALLEQSHASLASFSAYASASAPPSSYIILAVAGALAGADDALKQYAASVDEWREHLKGLKSLEDEVGNIMRDREILVTRLIKASRAQKPTRESLLVNRTSVSSLSLTSDFNASSSKLGAAQSELQACEAHLAAKERELDIRRNAAVKEGLNVRCKAMAECGWAWGEMGKEGLRALENLNETNGQPSSENQRQTPSPTQHQGSSTDHSAQPHSYVAKPLPDPSRPSSDLSSLSPSQSASQVNIIPSPPPSNADHHQQRPRSPTQQHHLNIPPAHSMSELTLPTSTSLPPRHVLPRRITEEDLHARDHNNSSSDDDIGPLEVVENSRFADGRASSVGGGGNAERRFSIRQGAKSDLSPVVSSESNASLGGPGKRDRKPSFFGSIRGLFRKDREAMSDKEARDDEEHQQHASVRGMFGSGGTRKWETRTDRNLKAMRRDGGWDNGRGSPVPSSPSPPRWVAGGATETGTTRKLKKGRSSSVGAGRKKAKASLGAADEGRNGYASDAGEGGTRKAQEWTGGQGVVSRNEEDSGVEKGGVAYSGVPITGKESKVVRRKSTGKVTGKTIATGAGNGANLSRNSSTLSAASTLVSGSRVTASRRMSSDAVPPIPTLPNGHRRAASIDGSMSPDKEKPKSKADRRGGVQTTTGEGNLSLMSIVEGVARQNREGWRGEQSVGGTTKQPGLASISGLEIVKAPRSLTRQELDESFSTQKSLGGTTILTEPIKAKRLVPNAGNGDAQYGMVASQSAPAINFGGRISRPAKSPLRSAMRTSRSPSPLFGHTSQPQPQISSSGPSRSSGLPNGDLTGKGKEQDDTTEDSASISSYETGREALDGDDEVTEHELRTAPPLPPPRDYSTSRTENNFGSDLSTSTHSTEPPHAPQRRKSVRVSLQPTFSPTPPALDDDDELRAPWAASGWQTRNGHAGATDMWEDSSDEDEEYKKAKRLLTRIARKQRE